MDLIPFIPDVEVRFSGASQLVQLRMMLMHMLHRNDMEGAWQIIFSVLQCSFKLIRCLFVILNGKLYYKTITNVHSCKKDSLIIRCVILYFYQALK